MSAPDQLLHLLLLGLSVAALGLAGVRIAGALVTTLSARLLGMVVIGAALAVAESLLLGVVGAGDSSWVLSAAAVATALMSRLVRPRAPGVARQVREWWAAAPAVTRASTGALAALTLGYIGYEAHEPYFGGDGLAYHAAQPAIWVIDGHIGSMHQTTWAFPTQAYPRSFEVLIAWSYAIGRTPVAGVPVVVGFALLLMLATATALRRVGVSLPITGLAIGAMLLIPANYQEMAGVFNDLAAEAWLACVLALCVITLTESAVCGLAVLATGVLLSTKPTTAPIAVIALGWTLWRQRAWLRSNPARWAAPVAAGIVAGGFWYVVTWVHYGGPLWPNSTFPAARPQPQAWQLLGRRFLSEPLNTLHLLPRDSVMRVLGGAVVLLAVIPLLLADLFAPVVRRSGLRVVLAVGVALAIVQLLLWSNVPFTGAVGDSPLTLSVLRYVIAAPMLTAGLLAIASRVGTMHRIVAGLLLLATIGVDLWWIAEPGYGTPYSPPVAVLAALAVIGAVAALVAGRAARRLSLALPDGLLAGGAAVSCLAVAAALTQPGVDFLHDYLVSDGHSGTSDRTLLQFLAHQPAWLHGHALVATAGPPAYASLAGPHFTHPLQFVFPDASCRQVRSLTRTGWLVVSAYRDPFLPGFDYRPVLKCLGGIPHVAVPHGPDVFSSLLEPARRS